MDARVRFVILALTMVVACVMVMLTMAVILYRHEISQQRELLQVTAQSQARLIEAIARNQSDESQRLQQITPEHDAYEVALSQVVDAHERYEGFGETGEFALARREGDSIVFVLRHRYSVVDRPAPVAFNSKLAEPMRLALKGFSGTIIGLDYRGQTVLAAYEPVAMLNLGIVAKIDLAEIRAPIIESALFSAAIGLVVVFVSTTLFFRIANPIVERLEAYSRNLEKEVDERRRSEQALRAEKAFTETVLEAQQDSFFLFDPLAGKAIRWNRAFNKVSGYSDEEIARLPVPSSYYGSEDLRRAVKAIENIPQAGATKIELELICKDGRKVPTEYNVAPVNDETGRPKYLLSVGRDVSERKQAKEALLESQRRLFTLMDNLPGMAYRCCNDSDWTMEFVSDGSRILTGYAPESLIDNRDIAYADLIHEHDAPQVWQQVQSALEADRSFKIEYRIHTANGQDRWVWEQGRGVLSPGGTLLALEGFIVDISERKQSEEALRRAQKMEAVGQLTGGIAHDFNNLLGIIQGNLILLQNILGDNERASRRVEKALAGTQRGADLTKMLLSFSRKDARGARLISVNKSIRNLEELIAKSLTVSIQVETRLADNLWLVEVDPGDLEDAILNLSLNARDAMPQGGKLVIKTANQVRDKDAPLAPEGDYVLLSVADTGLGMTDEVLEKALDPFFTTKDQGKGTGLGLSMVYGFVHRSGGQLKIDSTVGEGTTISIYLPRSHKQAGAKKTATGVDKKLPGGMETILIVDDEESLLEVAASYLQELGYETLTANSGQQALALLGDHQEISLVFSDIVMPGGLDGYQLALTVHQDYPAIRVLLASGFTKKREAYVNGENAYLTALATDLLNKPYSQYELANAIRHALDTKIPGL